MDQKSVAGEGFLIFLIFQRSTVYSVPEFPYSLKVPPPPGGAKF